MSTRFLTKPSNDPEKGQLEGSVGVTVINDGNEEFEERAELQCHRLIGL